MNDNMKDKNMIAKFLLASRYLLVIPVLGSVIMTAGAVIMGFGRIVTAVKRLQELGGFSPKASNSCPSL